MRDDEARMEVALALLALLPLVALVLWLLTLPADDPADGGELLATGGGTWRYARDYTEREA